jgi:hypothetical protein
VNIQKKTSKAKCALLLRVGMVGVPSKPTP